MMPVLIVELRRETILYLLGTGSVYADIGTPRQIHT